jgi:outer membrane protein assembly factor BamB
MRTGVSSSHLTGKLVLQWIIELGPIIASPVFESSTLYVPTITGRVFALNTYLKQIKWHSNIGTPLISSPLLYEDLLIAATFDTWVKDSSFLGKNLVFALNKNTGEKKWNFEITCDIFSSLCLANNLVILGSSDTYVYALDLNGNLQWRFKTEGEIWSSPSFNGSEIFVGSDDGFLYCLDLEGNLQWKTKLNGKVRSSSPCLSADNLIFLGTYNGGMYCLNQYNGSIQWYKHASKPVLSSPAVFKDKVFFASSDSKAYCFCRNDGSKLWEFETRDRIWSSAVLTENEGILFFGSLDTHIYGVDSKNGKQRWEFPTMNVVDSSGCIAGNALFIGGRDGLLYAFGSQRDPSYMG